VNLHFGINDRFIELFIQQANGYHLANSNHFIVYGETELAFSNYEYQNLTVTERLENSNTIADMVENSTSLYIHFLTDTVIDFLEKFNLEEKKVVWVFWGSDGFSIKSIRRHFYFPYYSPGIYFSALSDKLLSKAHTKKEKFIRKNIGYFAHYIKEDFMIFKPLLKEGAEFIYFSYGSCDKIVKKVTLSGNDLIIGNSADPANMHKRVLKNILPKDLSLLIHCPLSYSGSLKYRQEIAITGKLVFKDKFKPYLNLLNTDDYYSRVLSKCAYGILWHHRSQAWGNIMQLLSQGSKIFMNPKSNLYNYLAGCGFVIYPVKARLKSSDFLPLPTNLKKQNKDLLELLFGDKQTKRNYQRLLTL